MVPFYQNDMTIKSLSELYVWQHWIMLSLRVDKVTKVEHIVCLSDFFVPVQNESLIHLFNSLERPLAVLQYVSVVEMCV